MNTPQSIIASTSFDDGVSGPRVPAPGNIGDLRVFHLLRLAQRPPDGVSTMALDFRSTAQPALLAILEPLARDGLR